MPNTIILKRSAVAGRIPTVSDLELGEIAINTYMGRLYIKRNQSGVDSIVEIGGSTYPFTEVVSSPYIITANDYTVMTTTSGVVYLPTAIGIVGRIYTIKHVGSGTLSVYTIAGLSQTIDGELVRSLTQNECMTVQSTGSNWIII